MYLPYIKTLKKKKWHLSCCSQLFQIHSTDAKLSYCHRRSMNSQLNIFGKCLAKMKKKNVNSMMRDLRPRRGAGNSLHS